MAARKDPKQFGNPATPLALSEHHVLFTLRSPELVEGSIIEGSIIEGSESNGLNSP